MSDNRYATAGWVSIVAAILFPAGFIVGIVQGIIGIKAFDYRGPVTGPSDLIFLTVTAIGVYALVMLRRMLNERYDFHDVDLLITAAIVWNVFFQLLGIAMKLLTLAAWPVNELTITIYYLTYMVISMISIGIIDIVFAVKILRKKELFSDLMQAYAYITLISGASAVTVILTPLALILVPVSFVVLGMIFLREKEEVEFV